MDEDDYNGVQIDHEVKNEKDVDHVSDVCNYRKEIDVHKNYSCDLQVC